MVKPLYTLKEIRVLGGYSAPEVAKAIDVTTRHYLKVERGDGNLTLATGSKWWSYMLRKLEALPKEVVDWDRVPDLHDIASAERNEWTYKGGH